jgi:hypothetical protein
MVRPEANLTSKAKVQLGWADGGGESYKKWRKNLKAYAIIQKIASKRTCSDSTWEAFTTYAIDRTNGFPAKGRTLVLKAKGHKEGDLAKMRLNHLLLDSLKKDRATEVKEGLLSTGSKRQITLTLMVMQVFY